MARIPLQAPASFVRTINGDALITLQRLNFEAGPVPDRTEYAELWEYGMIEGDHSMARITEQGRKLLEDFYKDV